MSNSISINFSGETSVTIDPLWQYDTEQTMVFQDLTLPETYEVHFGNQKDRGVAIPVVATSSSVEIPDQVLADGRTVFAWVYADGMTTHRVIVPILTRPRPANLEISSEEATTITTLITQMQAVLTQVQSYADTVASLAEQVQSLVEEAEGLTATVDEDGYINIG